jgi:hypothetical protein
MAVNNQNSTPAENAFTVSPSNSTDLAHVTRGLWVGGAGDVKVDMHGGDSAVVFPSVPAGTLLPLAVTRVYSSGTTATNIVGVY